MLEAERLVVDCVLLLVSVDYLQLMWCGLLEYGNCEMWRFLRENVSIVYVIIMSIVDGISK